ncbi:hypothetical protein BD779DRAFT_1672226 [Infundibulicybe gibba]|nr:hypothetical protein BD779DRAFT_1672226 [Infundibulicybe gibba]
MTDEIPPPPVSRNPHHVAAAGSSVMQQDTEESPSDDEQHTPATETELSPLDHLDEVRRTVVTEARLYAQALKQGKLSLNPYAGSKGMISPFEVPTFSDLSQETSKRSWLQHHDLIPIIPWDSTYPFVAPAPPNMELPLLVKRSKAHAPQTAQSDSVPEVDDSFPHGKTWRCDTPYQVPVPGSGDSWKACHELAERYDRGMCEAWRDEIDKLLIFAGLFSATVTVFTIESYKWLQENPAEKSAQLLAQLSSQLAPQSEAQASHAGVSKDSFSPTMAAIRINCFWFLSLTLGLVTVLVGILCAQWLREYQRDAALSHQDALALRQLRHDALPLLLQMALVLFFIGLLDLLWALNPLLASLVTAVVGLSFIFLFVTTAAPTFQYLFAPRAAPCAFKSPQSWIFLHASVYISALIFWPKRWAIWPALQWNSKSKREDRMSPLFGEQKTSIRKLADWSDYDISRMRQVDEAMEESVNSIHNLNIRALSWLDAEFSQNVEVVHEIYHCMMSMNAGDAIHILSNVTQKDYPGAWDHEPMIAKTRVALDPQLRDSLSAIYLGHHKKMHPQLDLYQQESIIRILNINQQNVINHQIVEGWSTPNVLSHEVFIEYLKLCKSGLERNAYRTRGDIMTVWKIIGRVLNNSTADDHVLFWVWTVIEEYHRWLIKGPFDMDRGCPQLSPKERVLIGIAGLMIAFDIQHKLNDAYLIRENWRYCGPIMTNIFAALEERRKAMRLGAPEVGQFTSKWQAWSPTPVNWFELWSEWNWIYG